MTLKIFYLNYYREADLPFFSVDYQYHNNSKSLMKISALPLQLVLNEKCIRQIFSFFSTSHTTNRVDIFKNRFNSQEDNEKNENPTELSLSSKQTKSSTNTFGVVCVDLAAILSSSKHGLEVVFEAETPKIIVPENNTYKVFFFLSSNYFFFFRIYGKQIQPLYHTNKLISAHGIRSIRRWSSQHPRLCLI